MFCIVFFFFFQAEDGIRDLYVTGVQTCALPICIPCESFFSRWLSHLLRWPWRLMTGGLAAAFSDASSMDARPALRQDKARARQARAARRPRKALSAARRAVWRPSRRKG